MDKLSKMIKLMLIINLALLVGMLLYCYQHIFTEIPGECDECSVGASISYYIGLIFIIVQIILAIIMCCFIPFIKQKKLWMQIVTIVFGCANLFCAFMQFIAFSIEPMFDSHGDFTAESYRIIEAIEHEFDVAQIMSVILFILHIAVVNIGIYTLVKISKDKASE